MPDRQAEYIENWLVRTERKGPFYLVERYSSKRRVGNCYVVVWRDKDKIRLGRFDDGMYVRYGNQAMGFLKGTEISGLWSVEPGVLNEHYIQVMWGLARGYPNILPVWTPRMLKDLRV